MASSTIDSRVFGVLFASKARYHTDSSGCFFWCNSSDFDKRYEAF